MGIMIKYTALLCLISLVSHFSIDKADEFPKQYIKVIPGQTRDFDHGKFAKLKSKYLKDVNRAIAMTCNDLITEDTHDLIEPEAFNAFWTKQAISGNPFDIKSHRNRKKLVVHCSPRLEKEISQSTLGKCSSNIHPQVCTIILQRLKHCEVNPARVAVSRIDFDNQNAAALTYTSTINPETSLLILPNKEYKDSEILSQCCYASKNQKSFIREGHGFEFVVAHEAAHILYQDSLIRRLLELNFSDKNLTKFKQLKEKRADILGVFNSPNPVGSSLFFQNHEMVERTDLYIHRNHPDWQKLINDIKSCYSGDLAIAVNKSLIDGQGRSLFGAEIEHTNLR